MKIVSLITHPHVDLHSSLEHKLRYLWWNPRAFWPCIYSSGTLVNARRRLTQKRRNCWIRSLFLFSLHAKNYSRSFITLQLNHMDVTWTILTMSLLPFWALNVSVAFLSMEGQKALGFHLNLCSEDERRSYGFGTSWAWVINDRIFIFGWTVTLMYEESWTNSVQYFNSSYHSRFFFFLYQYIFDILC